MDQKTVFILGSGHLASRVKKLIAEKGYQVTHFTSLLSEQQQEQPSTIPAIETALTGVSLESFSMIYILFDKDEDNLETVVALMALFPEIPLYTSLFNENIRPHLEAAHSNLTILNPARLAAPAFVDALDYNLRRAHEPLNRVMPAMEASKKDTFLKLLVISFGILIFSATTYFHFYENFTWLDAFYFVIVTVSTVGYGDINLQNAASLSKLMGIALILCSTIFIWVIFSLVIDRIIKKRVQRLLGRKRYKYKNHIILCGLGRLGYFIAEELLKRGEKIIIVEVNEDSANSDYFRSKRVDVYNGNATLPRVLQDVGAQHCRALISVVNDDYLNLEIALNARYFQPNLRLILRIFDESMASVMKDKFDIHLTQSTSHIAAEKFAAVLDKPQNEIFTC
jgi:hypothetical protein